MTTREGALIADSARSKTSSEQETEKIRNFRGNIDRHKNHVDDYLSASMYQNLPEDYKDEYRDILDRHFAELQNDPIHPDCKFTLVLPAYREEKVILQTLESLENQEGIKPEEFEVIVVNNYPEGKKPQLNDYDNSGKKIGEHEDWTTEIVKEFAKTSKLKIRVVEQDFPDRIKGVGIASKLGMDLALKRQQDNPQIIGYYGTDTIFDKGWVKGALNGFANPNVDGVRGVAKAGPLSNHVEDEFGLHILTMEQLQAIRSLQSAEFQYSQRLNALESVQRQSQGENAKQLTGLPTFTAGIYAKIGGMKAYSPESGKAVTSGEDWRIAQDVADNGKIFWNKDMRTQTLARIEKPRTQGGSYTEELWAMFRAYFYGEGDLLDEDKKLLVEDPERSVIREKVTNIIKKMFAGQADSESESQLLDLVPADDLNLLKELMKKHAGNWYGFLSDIPQEIGVRLMSRTEERCPKMKLDDAEKKPEEIMNKM